MLEILLSSGILYGVCYIINIICKCFIADLISKSPDLSDEKAKAITKMMSKESKLHY